MIKSYWDGRSIFMLIIDEFIEINIEVIKIKKAWKDFKHTLAIITSPAWVPVLTAAGFLSYIFSEKTNKHFPFL